MQKEQERKIIYYSDELNDDFAGTNIVQKQLPENFKYINKNIFYKIGTFLLTCIIVPIIFLFNKIAYHQKFENKKVLKRAKHTGYFIYVNHTNACLDAFTPQISSCPKKAYIICNPDATSIKGIRGLVMMLGGIPLPTSNSLTFKYIDCIKERISKKSVIAIYPEAHIWPYYTDIRPFKADSFVYPVDTNKPVFSFTNIYKKRRFGKKPKVVTYIDGPFYPNSLLTKRENMSYLREKVYSSMKNRVESNPVYMYKYEYIKKEN